MKILQNSHAVFWKIPGSKQQFHADVMKTIGVMKPRGAYTFFKREFPSDIVCSVRDASGRFCSFK